MSFTLIQGIVILEFPCSKCGACCRNISNIPQLKEFDNGKGVCKFLNILLGTCEIYETRPDVCRIDKMYKKYFKHIYSKREFYVVNMKACNILQDKENIDTKFRIKF